MVCIYCNGSTNVINSRKQKRTNHVWRRRQCNECSALFSTLEILDYTTSLAIRMENGKLTPFSRDKLFTSIYEACKHRKDAIEDASALTLTIISTLMQKTPDGAFQVEEIISVSRHTLELFDVAAASHYTVFHPSSNA